MSIINHFPLCNYILERHSEERSRCDACNTVCDTQNNIKAPCRRFSSHSYHTFCNASTSTAVQVFSSFMQVNPSTTVSRGFFFVFNKKFDRPLLKFPRGMSALLSGFQVNADTKTPPIIGDSEKIGEKRVSTFLTSKYEKSSDCVQNVYGFCYSRSQNRACLGLSALATRTGFFRGDTLRS